MKKLIFAMLLILSTNAYSATAFWTGRQEHVQTVTYQWAWKCEYNYNGQYLYYIFSGMCQSSVDVY